MAAAESAGLKQNRKEERMEGLTPMMQQYFRIKDKHKDHLVFYRLGDFYEMFFDDAILASKELGLTLTGRDCGLSERAPMCGVPHHSSEGYVAKLIRKGYKVAICEQVEDPAFAKGVVSREVVRVVTPGTLVENNLLQEDNNNYLCSIVYGEGGFGLAFADISTGEVNLVEIPADDDNRVLGQLAQYSPREVIFNEAFLSKTEIAQFMREKLCCTADLLDRAAENMDAAAKTVLEHFQKDELSALGLTGKNRCVLALAGLLRYLAETQKVGLERLITVNVLEDNRFMALDQSARANLELLETQRAREKRGSLLWVLDKTQTPMGKRLIKTVINQPLVNGAEIEKRLNAVEELVEGELLCQSLRDLLGGVYDMERLITRIVYGNASPREYKTLEQCIEKLPGLKAELDGVKSQHLTGIFRDIDLLEDVLELLRRAICPSPPATIKDGGVIAEGYSAELDELRRISTHAKEYLTKLENDEKEKTGIRNLKIGFNKVFGYYLEVTKSYLGLVPETYIRKQTLANCERYIIQELKELEEKILGAHEQSTAIEQKLFEELRVSVARQLHRIQRTATAVARLDVYCSFACVCRDYRYVRPQIVSGDTIKITGGRHPAVELLLEGAPYVPNDALLDGQDNQIAIVTGPNMAGKSTYMRQVALIVLMAQIGCFVPAESASIAVVDGIYTRIGASDDLTTGQSTFMVEMCEVAGILKNATAKSLLILDEIGRGTSTYDGMSIARAVIEYIADKKRLGAKTLFATHYHELTEIEDAVPGVKNYNTAVKKRGDDITFLRKIVRGPADGSYGIEVSKLAGIPGQIVQRAHEILRDLESAQPVREARRRGRKPAEDGRDLQICFEDITPSEVEQLLKDVDLDTLTPIEALTTLFKLKEKVKI